MPATAQPIPMGAEPGDQPIPARRLGPGGATGRPL
jgi:hypothetical protein